VSVMDLLQDEHVDNVLLDLNLTMLLIHVFVLLVVHLMLIVYNVLVTVQRIKSLLMINVLVLMDFLDLMVFVDNVLNHQPQQKMIQLATVSPKMPSTSDKVISVSTVVQTQFQIAKKQHVSVAKVIDHKDQSVFQIFNVNGINNLLMDNVNVNSDSKILVVFVLRFVD
jgi:hypothetical protein